MINQFIKTQVRVHVLLFHYFQSFASNEVIKVKILNLRTKLVWDVFVKI